MTHLFKEEVAAQVVAVINAKFEKLTLEDIDDVLKRAYSQVKATSDTTPSLSVVDTFQKAVQVAA
jgi:hypothetical protein